MEVELEKYFFSSFRSSPFFISECEYQICLGNWHDGGGKTAKLQRLSWREREREKTSAVLCCAVLCAYPSELMDFFLQVSKDRICLEKMSATGLQPLRRETYLRLG